MKVEHPIGLEPITRCLQGSRSTIELREQIAGIRGPAPHQEECQGKSVFYHDISIAWISDLFVSDLSQVLHLRHAVSANSVSPESFIFSAVQFCPADM